MPYNASGGYDPTIPKDANGFYNETSVSGTTNPYEQSYAGMNAAKARPLIDKEIG